MKKRLPNIILILIFIAGLSLLLYPTLSDYWNSLHQSQMIAEYMDNVSNLDSSRYEELLAEAHAYNEELAGKGPVYLMSEEQRAEYERLLDVSGTGIMGYIEIPGIDCTLPVYHGTDENVLAIAIGHIEWSSLPVGGKSTHTVISGHRGLPSAKLFTDIDQLSEGDLFYLDILGDTLAYEVDQIRIVLPEEMDALQIVEGEDLCTLVTCTPYGINTHRLLVRGHRVEGGGETHVAADAIQIDPLTVAPVAAVPMLLLLLAGLLIATRRRAGIKNNER